MIIGELLELGREPVDYWRITRWGLTDSFMVGEGSERRRKGAGEEADQLGVKSLLIIPMLLASRMAILAQNTCQLRLG